jgi:hypothetical protein
MNDEQPRCSDEEAPGRYGVAGKEPAPDRRDRDAEGEEQQPEEANGKPWPRWLPDGEGGKRDEKQQREARTLPLTL